MTRGSRAPREEGFYGGVEGAGDTQRRAHAYAHAALGALDGAATHFGALRELGAREMLPGAEYGDRVVHALHSTQVARRRKVSFNKLFSCTPSREGLFMCRRSGSAPAAQRTMLNVVAALTPPRRAALHLLETADLDVVPTRTGWAIIDPEQPAATALIAEGDTLAAAIDAALPVALADGYVTAADVEELDGPAEPDECWRCDGCGEGSTPLHVCPVCRGSGSARVAQ